jgi:hypothetical protein
MAEAKDASTAPELDRISTGKWRRIGAADARAGLAHHAKTAKGSIELTSVASPPQNGTS